MIPESIPVPELESSITDRGPFHASRRRHKRGQAEGIHITSGDNRDIAY